ncbi:hypothetical protein RYX36_004849, partial [Vicia faba]
LTHVPSANEYPKNVMINVNLDKSSSRVVYEYFTNKCKDIITSDVTKNFNSFIPFNATMTEIE